MRARAALAGTMVDLNGATGFVRQLRHHLFVSGDRTPRMGEVRVREFRHHPSKVTDPHTMLREPHARSAILGGLVTSDAGSH